MYATSARTMGLWVERFLLLATLIFLVASATFPPHATADKALPSYDNPTRSFSIGGVYPTTDMRVLPLGVTGFGSWIGSDAATGSFSTSWYPGLKLVGIFVSGYPNRPGMSLKIETDDGTRRRFIPISISDPGEKWQRVVVSIGAVKRFRIVAVDKSKTFEGWLGFTSPLVPGNSLEFAADQETRILGTCLLVLVLVFGPGLLLARRWPAIADGSFIFLPGIFSLALTGVIYWIGGGGTFGKNVLICICTIFLFGLLFSTRRRTLISILEPSTRRALTIALAVFFIAVGRSMFALGPAGELYGGTISRTYEPGDRSDSRINYHIVQLALAHESPYGAAGVGLFAPWTFSDRGPIAGLAAAPIVLLAGGVPSPGLPDMPWSIFDPQGFEAYRIAMFAYACLVFISFFGAVRRIGDTSAALFAVAVTALAPFVVHETFFTWPKLFATAFVCTSCSLAAMKRPLSAGVVLGLGYLIHPSVLFALLSLIGAYLVSVPDKAEACRRAALTLAGVVIVAFLWRVGNGAHYSQGGFLSYIVGTGDYAASVQSWVHSRLDSFCNTFLPFWLLIFNSSNIHINRLSGISSLFIHVQFSYWSTFPFAIGLTYLMVFSKLTWNAMSCRTLQFIAIIAMPLLAFTIYWGSASTGMMREGLHWWLFALVGFVAICERHINISKTSRILLIGRILEVWLVTFGLVMLDQHAILSSNYRGTDIVAILLVLVASAVLVRSAFLAIGPADRSRARASVSEG